MDPLSVFKTLWNYKWVSIPLVALTALVCAYGMLWAPRTYESSATFALEMPSLPTERELENDPEVAALNADNPYLRWNDTSLLAQVVIARMSSTEVLQALEDQGLSTEFTLIAPAGTTSGILALTGSDSSPERATQTVTFLSEEFTRILRDVQSVNHADDLYLIQAMPISGPTPAEEVFSSRLRFTAILGAGGAILVFGGVSVARSITEYRRRTGRAGAHLAARERDPSGERAGEAGAMALPPADDRIDRRPWEDMTAEDAVLLDDRGLPLPQHAGR